MSQEDAETVRRFFEALNRSRTGDFFPADLFDPAVEFDFSRRLVDPGVYRGLEAVRRWVEEEWAVYGAIEIVPEEVISVGDKLVASVVARGMGVLSGAAVEASVVNVLTFRAGRLLRLEYFGDREEAMRAVKLAE